MNSKGIENGKRRQLWAGKADWEYLRMVGGGNISLGLRMVLEAHRESRGDAKKQRSR